MKSKKGVKVTQAASSVGNNVTIKVMKGNTTIKTIKNHNNATFRLFSGILQFLRGDFTDIANNQDAYGYIPLYLGAGAQSPPTDTDPTRTSLNAEINFGSGRIKLARGNIAIQEDLQMVTLSLTALIPYSSVKEQRITELGLFATKNLGTSSLLARVIIDKNYGSEASPEYGLKVESGQSLFIQWDINIQNLIGGNN